MVGVRKADGWHFFVRVATTQHFGGTREIYVTEQIFGAICERLERATWDVCFLVSIFQVREEFVSFFVSPSSRAH